MLAPDRDCPQCGRAMQLFFVERVELDRCFFCRATWFDRGELERVLGRVLTPKLEGDATARRCVACREPLWPASLNGRRVDVCVACGGTLATDQELQHAVARTPWTGVQRALFLCMGCKDKYAVTDARRVDGGLSCPRCLDRFPGSAPQKPEPEWLAWLLELVDLFVP